MKPGTLFRLKENTAHNWDYWFSKRKNNFMLSLYNKDVTSNSNQVILPNSIVFYFKSIEKKHCYPEQIFLYGTKILILNTDLIDFFKDWETLEE